MKESATKWALVTGSSGGIGYELAKLLGRDGYSLVLVARSESKLREIAGEFTGRHGVIVKVVVKDLSRPEAPEELFQEIERQSIPVEILVNNAGFGTRGRFLDTDLRRELEMIRLNITALTQLTKFFLNPMVRCGRGKILNVASTAAFQPGPLMAVYYATKAYVLSFSEAIARELKGTGVSVTVLCPGPTRTGFQERAGIEKTHIIRAGIIMNVESVARSGYDGLMKGKTLVIPGMANKIFAFMVKFIPRPWVTAEDAPALAGVSEAVPARGHMPRAGGDPKGRPLTRVVEMLQEEEKGVTV